MTRSLINAQTTPGAYPSLPFSAGSTNLAWTGNSDATNRYTPLVEGKTLVLINNVDTATHTATFTSVADSPFNRTGDLVDTIGPGKIAMYGPFKGSGWSGGGGAGSGNLAIDVSDAHLNIAVITQG